MTNLLTQCSLVFAMYVLLTGHGHADELRTDVGEIRLVNVFESLDGSEPRVVPAFQFDGESTPATVVERVSSEEAETPVQAEQEATSAMLTSGTDDVLQEFEKIALWSGVVIVLAGVVLVGLKAWSPNWQRLAENSRLRSVASLQLRMDTQVFLVEADQQPVLLAVDRQGVRFLLSLNSWGDMSLDETANDSTSLQNEHAFPAVFPDTGGA
ncbi:MAG: flagellar biosynthetic protein FliO [Planctomycetaceae bacterium]|nr:flagellar biosynthetic protein FliO [Planctomycetaceae bacterium]MCB9952690.1 flagellar biosynthetic protein FliO [Planctomycetaceae bacterium]